MGQGNDASCECPNRSGLGDAAGDDESEFHDASRSALDCVLQVITGSVGAAHHEVIGATVNLSDAQRNVEM
ncbi:hypothetical protein D3C86_1889480 [compost metagenome]